MADISKELKAWKEAVYGEEVRDAQIDLSNKLNNEVEAATETVKNYGAAEAARVEAEKKRQESAEVAIKNTNNATVTANATVVKMDALYENVKATDLGGLEIGGRNYATDYTCYGVYPKYGGNRAIASSTTASFDTDGYLKVTWITGTDPCYDIGKAGHTANMIDSQPLKSGDNVAFSFDFMGNRTTDSTYKIMFYSSNGITYVNKEVILTAPSASKWKRYSFAWTIPDGAVNVFFKVVLRSAAGEIGDWFKLRDVMIENATTPSDAVPAVEDTAAAIAAKKTDLWANCYSDMVADTRYYKLAESATYSNYGSLMLSFMVSRNYSGSVAENAYRALCAINIGFGAGGVYIVSQSTFNILASSDNAFDLSQYLYIVVDSSNAKVYIYAQTGRTDDGWRIDFIKTPSARSGINLNITTYTYSSGSAGEAAEPTGAKLLPTPTREATASSAGLMSAKDKAKLDGIISFAVCATAAGTVAKTVTLTGFNLVEGARATIKFTNAITVANATLNINSTGAKTIVDDGIALEANRVGAGTMLELIYDGTNWVVLNDTDSGWLTLTPASGFVLYSSDDTSVLKYRRFGKVVEIEGVLSPSSAITGSATEIIMFTLPAGFRPGRKCLDIKQGSSRCIWAFTLYSSGTCMFARYRDETGYVSAAATTWLPCGRTFMV